ncbi:MAG: RsmB/NOP family class I SAM-dependent RNA methyltransferase [Candidatus Heimdallarchaeota archaeon]
MTHLEKNQVSLRNAMKIFPTLSSHTDPAFYAQVNALTFETIRYRNTLNRLIYIHVQRFLSEALPESVLNLLRVVIYLLALAPGSQRTEQWRSGCLAVLKTITSHNLPKILMDFDSMFKDWHLSELLLTINDPEERLAVQFAHPTWLVRDFTQYYGREATVQILTTNNKILPTYLRLNLMKHTKDEIIQTLRDERVTLEEDPDLDDIVRAVNWELPLPRLTSFKKGLYYIQNKGSALVSHILDPRPGETVLDVCAAPGGKTTHIAALQQEQGRIIALDNHERRIAELTRKIKLYELRTIYPLLTDVRKLPVNNLFHIRFDKILVDAPCSGTGTFSSRPDAKWRINRHQVKWLSKLQLALLSQASALLKPKLTSRLVYATCSLLPMENEDVIAKFLDENPDFTLKPQAPYIGTPMSDFPFAQRLFPHKTLTEGFSIFKLGLRN